MSTTREHSLRGWSGPGDSAVAIAGWPSQGLSSPILTRMNLHSWGERPLIIGESGQVGSAVRRLLPAALAPPRARLDLIDLDSLPETLAEFDATAIINCAAWTDVDGAEDHEDLATIINAYGVEQLAAFSAARGLPFVTFSTDYVFDGSASAPYVESASTSPINAYGRSKELGEELALAANPDTLVIRSSWIVSGTHPSFLSRILAEVAVGSVVRVVDDQQGRPTIAGDLAKATLHCLSQGTTGLLHVTNAGEASWFDLAREATRSAGFDTDLVQPCPSETYRTKAARPRYSVLGTERKDDQPPALPSWKASLERIVPAILGRLS
jgi:dTDP-4-dehydrorhamnose reductase